MTLCSGFIAATFMNEAEGRRRLRGSKRSAGGFPMPREVFLFESETIKWMQKIAAACGQIELQRRKARGSLGITPNQ